MMHSGRALVVFRSEAPEGASLNEIRIAGLTATIVLALSAAGVAGAQPGMAAAREPRDFCPDRPGLGTPACTMDRGRTALELGLLDWTRDQQPGARSTTLRIGDLLLRHGLTDQMEAQLGWTVFGEARERVGAATGSETGVGDVTLALRRNLRNPDGSGLAVAVMPFATLPTGGQAIGAGDWSAGVLLPVSQELPAGFQLAFTGSLEAAADGDAEGRHPAFGAVLGLDVPVSNAVEATIELSARRDRDPSGAATEWLSGISAAWSPEGSFQVDVGANLALDRSSPDVQLYLGIARRF